MRSRHHRLNLHLRIQRISFTGFPAALTYSHYRNVSKQTTRSLIHIESRKSPTAVLFDVDTGRISICHGETKEYHSEYSGKITRIMLPDDILRDLEWLGRIVHCIIGSMMTIFNTRDHLSDSHSNSIDAVSYLKWKNKQKANTSANVISNKENVIDVDVGNASKAKTLLCVSCLQNVLIPCHDKCLAKHKLNVRSNVCRTFFTNSRTPKSLETTYVAPKTNSRTPQSKTLDTTSVVSKSKINVESASKAKDKVSNASRIKKTNLRDKPLSTFIKNKIQTSRIWQKWFESQPNVIWTLVSIKLNVHNTRSSEKPSVLVQKWVVKLPSCPCDVSSCVASSSDYRSLGC
ncbi:hypothetical protein Tco_1335771 [Tanacetum coccineum]